MPTIAPTAAREPASVMTASDQTRLSWARPIRSLDEVPAVYQPFFRTLPAGTPFPYSVLTPTFAGFMRRETERLICFLDDQLYILEKSPSELKCTCLPLSTVNYVETGAVLLKAWFKVQGLSEQGILTTIILRFNAVTDRLFKPFVEQIRGLTSAPISSGLDEEDPLLDSADLLTYKFRNYARSSLARSLQLIAVAAQREIRHPVLRLGRWSYQRTDATTHIYLVTDRELIVISDDPESPAWQDDTRYGGVWDYVPLNKIERLALVAKNAYVLTLLVGLTHGGEIECPFAPERRAEAERLLHCLLEWAPEAVLV